MQDDEKCEVSNEVSGPPVDEQDDLDEFVEKMDDDDALPPGNPGMPMSPSVPSGTEFPAAQDDELPPMPPTLVRQSGYIRPSPPTPEIQHTSSSSSSSAGLVRKLF
jgi:hypothetical protein